MSKKPIVYICHQISGNVEENLKEIRTIYEEIFREGNVVPFAPYLECFNFLQDDDVEDRFLGIQANKVWFEKKYFDVLWVYGKIITKGMQEEISWCDHYGIEVFYMDNLSINITHKEKELLLKLINNEISNLSNLLTREIDATTTFKSNNLAEKELVEMKELHDIIWDS